MPSRFWKASGNALLPSCGFFVPSGGGGFSPSSLSGITGWWEADPAKVYHDLGTTLATDTQTVRQMNDKSSAGRNVSDQSFGTAYDPTFHSGTKPKLTFDGSSNSLGINSQTGLTDANGQLWGALSFTPTTNLTGFYKYFAIDGTNNIFTLQTGGSATVTALSHSTSPVGDTRTLTLNTPCVLIWQVTWNGSAGTIELWLDNVSDGSSALTAAPNTGSTNVWIGSDNSGSGFAPMDFYGLVIGTGTTMTDSTNRGNLQTYMAALHP